MLPALLGFTIFCLIYYGLWSVWCSVAPDLLEPGAPAWLKRPNFFLFFVVTLVLVLLFRSASRE